VRQAEQADASALLTLHLAYSPSLECIEALARTPLPILVVDTTPAAAFGPDQEPGALMHNHGIHGVQDMCNLLVRRGKWFAVEAGHWRQSDVLDRVATWLRSARMARRMRAIRVGRVGEPFQGMGDFQVEPARLQADLGLAVVTAGPRDIAALMPHDGDPEVAREVELDRQRFDASGATPQLHRDTVRAGLAVRRWLQRERLGAYALNFLALTADCGLPAVPFLEASKAMQRGLGYAGEGDVLTASLVAALASTGPATFTEMFCPDWQGNRIFLSHQGELNLDMSDGTPLLVDKHWDFIPLADACIAAAALRPGDGVLVNLAPVGEYRLLVVPVEIVPDTGRKFAEMIRGWIRPRLPIADLLAAYSRAGGTHHCALASGRRADEIAGFGAMMGWDTLALG
jgi:L-arabinose isomerase